MEPQDQNPDRSGTWPKEYKGTFEKGQEGVWEVVSEGAAGAGVAAGQAQAVVESKRRFIDNVAHQIKTLSNAIVGFCDLLTNERLTDSQTEYVSEIYHSSLGLLSLVNKVLDVSRIETNHLVIDPTECSVKWLLEEIGYQLEGMAGGKGLYFSINHSTALPASIRSDPVRLRQCLIDIIGTSIKFTEEGFVQIDVSIEERTGGYFMRFDVIDSGSGIDDRTQNELFELYAGLEQHSEMLLKSLGQGGAVTGGLGMARYLIKVMGGEIVLSSEPGSGSKFSLVVPTNVDVPNMPLLEAGDDGFLAGSEDQTQAGRCSGRVLLVDDAPSNRTVITLLLETLGLEVDSAQDGVAGVEKATQGAYDLIIMDLKMPRMNGCEAAKAMRGKGILAPIIALSAGSISEVAESGDADLFDSHLAKPVDSRKLFDAVKKYLCIGAAKPQTLGNGMQGASGSVAQKPAVELSADDEPVWMAKGKAKR